MRQKERCAPRKPIASLRGQALVDAGAPAGRVAADRPRPEDFYAPIAAGFDPIPMATATTQPSRCS